MFIGGASRRLAGWPSALALAIAGCGGGPGPVGPGTDAQVVCGVHSDCDDGIFCNGTELCDPDAAGADDVGCVAGAPPCEGSFLCEEPLARCTPICGDVDGDGHEAIGCGSGDDCDDDDAERFPGNVEVCDADAHDEDCDDTTLGDRDVDGDLQVSVACCNGTRCGEDCDDTRRGTNTGVPEVCDDVDNDCDGATDEGLLVALHLDADHDGIGDAAREIVGCPGTPGLSDAVGDCDDTRASVRPTAPEICDVIDNDCDGTVDEETVAVPWYVDADHDGWGTVSMALPSVDSCVAPADRAIRVGDCDDSDAMISPTAGEQCNGRDDDCDGRADYLVGGRDTEDDDLDGVPDAACSAPTADCNDRDPLISVAASAEICDDLDNDCDGRIDEGAVPVDWYVDMDGDRFGDPASAAVSSCDVQPGRTLDRTDCDDLDPGTHPGAADSCSGRLAVDDDCDGTIDEGGVALTIYADLDGDGFGTGAPIRSCLAEALSATRDGDCDDAEARVHPDALDDCAAIMSVDDDCDGRVDETLVPRTFYADSDGDGYGTGAAMTGCAQPAATATRTGDCDDATILRNPGVPDDCATMIGVDDDCDAATDEGRTLIDFFLDNDDDGFGAGPAMPACTAPAGTVAFGGDCDDTMASRNPGAPDDCSRPMSVDDDCDGTVDEDAMFRAVFRDADGDGFGSGASMLACGTPVGYSTAGGDCNESDVAIHPARPDDCTTRPMVDDDCDGMVDDGVVLRAFYPDGDMDGYGTGTAVMACSAPAGHALAAGDCDDTNRNRSPGRADDCSGTSALDDDCDTRVDEAVIRTTYHRDADADTYGDPTVTMQLCAPMTGWVSRAGDCDDSRMAVRPGGTEVCANGLDDDCDTLLDCADMPCSSACGTLELVSGGGQSAAIHALYPMPLRVRVRDGAGMPLAGRAVTLATTSVTAPSMTLTTDATGEATFTGLRAPFLIGTETIRATALGVPDLPVPATGTAPPARTVLSAINGSRNNTIVFSGPAWRASVSDNQLFGMVGAPDGSIYYVANHRILRVRPEGDIEHVAGTGSLGFTPMVPSADARTTAIWMMGNAPIALDAPRNRLFYAQDCVVFVIDLASHAMDRYVGNGSCTNSGDGGLAIAAGSAVIGQMAVTDAGVLWFLTQGSHGPPRSLRYVDTAGRIGTVLTVGAGTPALRVGGFFSDVAAIPGDADHVLLAGDCEAPVGQFRECILRVDTAGNLEHVAGAVGSDATPEGIAARMAVLSDDITIEALSTGEIAIADHRNHRIRVIDAAGIIRTVGGTLAMPGDTGEGGPASAALMRFPYWMSRFGGDHLVFTQAGERTIRVIW